MLLKSAYTLGYRVGTTGEVKEWLTILGFYRNGGWAIYRVRNAAGRVFDLCETHIKFCGWV